MKIFKIKAFDRWAGKEGLEDGALYAAVEEMNNGLFDANLGGHVYKKRIGLQGRGKRGGVRTLVTFKLAERAFFLYGFAKNERDNVDNKELRALRLLAVELLGYGDQGIVKAINAGELIEVINDE